MKGSILSLKDKNIIEKMIGEEEKESKGKNRNIQDENFEQIWII